MLKPSQPFENFTLEKPLSGFDSFTRIFPVFISMMLIGFVFYQGHLTVYGLSWPYDPDAFRDIAQAQVILDGDYPADYAYQGETLWYNPLTAFMIAGYSHISGLTAYEADVHLGLWINLLIPISFFVLVAIWFDTWTALAALVGFLFFVPLDRPTFAAATYSPWLFAPHLTQFLFYMTLVTYSYWLKNLHWFPAFFTGLLLGITFLGHTAPAVLLGGIMLLTIPIQIWTMSRGESKNIATQSIKGFVLILVTAFIVSLPYSYSILFNYHLSIINSTASTWVYDEVSLENSAEFISGLVVLSTAIGLLGAYALRKGIGNKSIRYILLAWLMVAAIFFLNGYIAQKAGQYGRSWIQITPGYHYLLYLSALKYILFGVGVVHLCRLLTPVFLRGIRGCSSHIAGWTQTAVGLCCLGMSFWAWDDYRNWRELEPLSQNLSSALNSKSNPYFWIRENVSRNDVFLCDDMEGLHMVVPAGAKVLVLENTFSNIYVNWQEREDVRREIMMYFESGGVDAFMELASNNGVSHLLLNSSIEIPLEFVMEPRFQLEHESPLGNIYSLIP